MVFAEPMINKSLVPAPGVFFIALPGVFYFLTAAESMQSDYHMSQKTESPP
jgi:hypothetical protein